MKKLITFIVLIALVAGGVYFGPKLVHKCDSCETWFFGTGYEANVLVDAISEADKTICKECAEKHHALGTAFGKDLSEYKKKLFD